MNRPLRDGLLAVGYVALAAAVLVAYRTPASTYEISVYAGTPTGYWVGIGVAILASFLAWFDDADGYRFPSLFLAGSAVSSLVFLPVVRNYHFFASADSMSHLGWTRDLASAGIDPTDLFYPGLHVLGVLTSDLTGLSLPRSLMIVAALFTILYIVFAALTVRILTRSGFGTTVGVFSALLLLPFNLIVIKLSAHPISQTSLYFAFVLFLVTRVVLETRLEATNRRYVSKFGLLLVVAFAGLVLFHPLGAFVALVLVGTMSLVQLAVALRSTESPIASTGPLYVPTLFLAAWFLLWVAGAHEGLIGQAARVVGHVSSFVQGGSGTVGEVVTERQSSLQQAGTGLAVIFLRLFLVSTVYVFVTGVVMLAAVAGRFERFRGTRVALKLFLAGLAVLVPITLLQFVGSISSLYFRYVGFMMVVGTVVGAFGLYYVGQRRDGRRFLRSTSERDGPGRRVVVKRLGLAVLMAGMLALSLATLYPSQFVLQPSGHITEAQMTGYETAFDRQAEGTPLASIGMGVSRYRHAVDGTSGRAFGEGVVPSPDYDHDLVGFMNDGRGGGQYLVLSSFDRVSRAETYRGIRFDRRDFRNLRREPNVDRVVSNGDVAVYLSESNETSSGASPASRAPPA